VDRGLLQNFVEVANGFGYLPVLYFDPSMLPAYPEEVGGEYKPEASVYMVREIVAQLFDVVKPERRHAVALVSLSKDQYRLVEGEISKRVESGAGRRLWVIDADEVLEEEKADFVKDLVENYSGCTGEVVERVAGAVASFVDNYAVAAVLAADWLKSGKCRGEEVEKAVKEAEGNVHRFVFHYLWYGLFNGNNVTAERYAPLLLAVGFFGPHPPKLAEAVVRAFGGEPEDAVVRWFSQPLHGTFYEVIEKVAHGAVYRQFGVGSDELCQGSVEGACRLVEVCAEALVRVPRRRYNGVEEVAVEYAKVIAEKLEAPGLARVRQIDFLINDFLRAHNGMVEDGRWRIRYETKEPDGVKVVEDVVDELDIMAALYGLAVLPVWYLELDKWLKEWFFVSDRKVEVIGLYLYPLLKKRGKKLVKRAVKIVRKMRERGFYTYVDLLRAVGIAAAGQWNCATDERVEKAVKLAAIALDGLATATPIVLRNVYPLLSEAWRRVVSGETRGDRRRRQRLADELTVVVLNAAIGQPLTLLHFFAFEKEEPDPEVVSQRFDALYNAASNAGKLQLLDILLNAWGHIGVAATLLGNPQLMSWEVFEVAARRVEGFVSHLHGVERAYVVARLYPRLALLYPYFGKFYNAAELAEESLKELWKAYGEDKTLIEERLRPYLELRLKPDLWEELNVLSLYVYYHIAFAYMGADKLGNAVEYAEKACKLAERHGNIYDEVSSCGLLPRLEAVRDGIPPVDKFKELWQRASRAFVVLGVEAIAATLGHYVVALASLRRLDDVKKVLEEWGWALELVPKASALTYGVLSLFDSQYLKKAVEELFRWTSDDLPKFADALHKAIETGLFANEPEIAVSAREALTLVYSRDMVRALFEVASESSRLFLSALVGLAYCKRGEEWGLKLAKAAARVGSGFKGIDGRLFSELAKALESATVDKCITDDVLKAVYRLYYRYV